MLWRRCSNVEATSWQRWKATLSQRWKLTSVQLSFSTVPQRCDNLNNDVVTTLSQRHCASWVNIWSYWWKGGGPKLLISGDSRSWLSFGCIGLFPTFSWRNAICSKNWHLGNFDATTPDFMSSLRLSRNFFNVPFKFFSYFFKMLTKTNKIHFHTKQLTERWWYP